MPVGSLGAVKGVTSEQLAEAGASIMLSNLYHLALRPGVEAIEQVEHEPAQRAVARLGLWGRW